jgi:hypothetical protein
MFTVVILVQDHFEAVREARLLDRQGTARRFWNERGGPSRIERRPHRICANVAQRHRWDHNK